MKIMYTVHNTQYTPNLPMVVREMKTKYTESRKLQPGSSAQKTTEPHKPIILK